MAIWKKCVENQAWKSPLYYKRKAIARCSTFGSTLRCYQCMRLDIHLRWLPVAWLYVIWFGMFVDFGGIMRSIYPEFVQFSNFSISRSVDSPIIRTRIMRSNALDVNATPYVFGTDLVRHCFHLRMLYSKPVWTKASSHKLSIGFLSAWNPLKNTQIV